MTDHFRYCILTGQNDHSSGSKKEVSRLFSRTDSLVRASRLVVQSQAEWIALEILELLLDVVDDLVRARSPLAELLLDVVTE